MSKIIDYFYLDENGKPCEPIECQTVVNLWETIGAWFGFEENLPVPDKFLHRVYSAVKAKKEGAYGNSQFFIRFINDHKDGLLERTYALRIKKSKIINKLLVDAYGDEFAKDNATEKYMVDAKEVYRRNGKQRWEINSLRFCGMAGWRVDWPDLHKSNDYQRCSGFYYWGCECDDYVSEITNSKQKFGAWVWAGPSMTDYQKLKNVPPHFIINKSCFHRDFDIFGYIEAFQKYPEIEMVVKSGLGYLWQDTKLLNAKKETKKQVIRFIKTHKDYIDRDHPFFTEICTAIKGNCNSREETNKFKNLMRTVSKMKRCFKFDESLGRQIHKYLEKQEISKHYWYSRNILGDYVDYLQMSKDIGRDIHDRGVLFPKSFQEQSESITKLFKEKQSAEYQQMYAKRYMAFAIPDSMVADPGFYIKPIIDSQELVDLGNHLHNCIGTGRYGEKVIKGECLLFKIEHEGKPIRCVEVSIPGTNNYKTFSVIQNRGDHNQNAEFDAECRKVANKLVRYLNKSMTQARARA